MADESAPSMGDVLGNAGEPVQITAGGKTWKLAYPTPAAIDRVEKLIAARYVSEVAALADVLAPDEFEQLRKGMRADLASRVHRAGGPMWQKVLSDPGGMALYLLGLFQHCHPAMTADEAEAIQAAAPLECDAAIDLVSPFFFALVSARMRRTPEQVLADVAAFRERVAARKATQSPAGSSS